MSDGSANAVGILGGFKPDDFYSFTIVNAETITLTLSSLGQYSGPVTAYLLNGSAGVIASAGSTAGVDGSLVEGLAAGTYYVHLNGGDQSAYNLTVTDATPTVGAAGTNIAGTSPGTAKPLGTLGTTDLDFAGWVGVGNANDYYSFSLGTASTLQVTLSGLSAGAQIVLENAADESIGDVYGFATANASLTDPLAAGSYFLVIENVSSESTSTGYHLTVGATPIVDNAGTTSATALSMGTLGASAKDFPGTIAPVETPLWYSFTLSAASNLSLQLSGLSQATEITLFKAGATTSIAANSSGGYLTNATMLEALAAGTYFVSLTAGGEGDFQLTAQATPVIDIAGNTTATARAIGALAAPASFTGALDPVNTADVFGFALAAGNEVNIALSAYGSGDVPDGVKVTLVDGSGTLVQAGTASYSGDALFSEQLAAGNYFVEVTPQSLNETANYTLGISAGAPAVGTAGGSNPGSTLATAAALGTLDSAGITSAAWVGTSANDDYYQFVLAQTSRVDLDLTGTAPGSDVYLFLQNHAGTELADGYDNATLGASVIQVLSAGTYYVDTRYTAGTGGTGINLLATATSLVNNAGTSLATAENTGSLTPATETFTGYVGPGASDAFYEFTLSAAATVSLELSGLLNGAYVDLDDSTGTNIALGSGNIHLNGWIGADLTAGTYYVDVNAPGGYDNFTLSMSATPIVDTAGVSFATATSLGTLDAPCFAAGTRIQTARGLVAVEQLRVGDVVIRHDGRPAPVRWLGHRRVDCRGHPRPRDVWPVRVCAGAFGDGRPGRDLTLSPDHAVLANGALIPIRYLINGRTVVQEFVTKITYYHVELPTHAVIVAEGMPCESYLDTGNRSAFANAGALAPVMLHPEFARGVWAAQACAELVLDGVRLTAAKRRLLEHAQALGHRMIGDSGLRVIADGRAVQADIDGRTWRIRLPPAARSVRLVSATWVPACMQPEADDTRSLGVAIGGLRFDREAIRLGDPRLSSGWHAAEPEWRWTDGDAGLALAGVRDLAFEVVMSGSYWADGASKARGAAPSALG